MCSLKSENRTMSEKHIDGHALRSAFAEYDRRVIITNVKVGCLIGVLLMPAGAILDWFVYPPDAHPGVWWGFLKLRFLCSLLIGIFWFAVVSPVGHKHPRPLGILLAMFPSFFISLMIYLQGGSESLYYAGLNLVLLVIGFVLHWTLAESAIAVSLVVAMYVVACALHGPLARKEFASNMYFLILTGIIVVIGSYVHSRWRFREFALRYELDLNRRELETSNSQLSHKKEELENSNSQLSQKTGELEQTLVELRQTQDQLVTKEKQASLGVWSAGIIHEINNPLNFARTGLYALRHKEKLLPPAEVGEFKELVTDIEDGIKRVHLIVSDLRMYAHPGKEDEREEVPVADVIRVALRFFSGDLQGQVEVRKDIPDDQTVCVNRNKLIQVIGNLLQNSVDALKLKKFDGAHPVISIQGRLENGRSKIILRDNGPGIEKDKIDKIFDPFFTTKDVGEGMGLGLGICYRIIQDFGGTISVRTEPGEFCEFTLDLPSEKAGKQTA